jgi:hypothetical protein
MFSCCINCGSTNDAMAWNLCGLKRILDSGALPSKYYIIGDEAFVCATNF